MNNGLEYENASSFEETLVEMFINARNESSGNRVA